MQPLVLYFEINLISTHPCKWIYLLLVNHKLMGNLATMVWNGANTIQSCSLVLGSDVMVRTGKFILKVLQHGICLLLLTSPSCFFIVQDDCELYSEGK